MDRLEYPTQTDQPHCTRMFGIAVLGAKTCRPFLTADAADARAAKLAQAMVETCRRVDAEAED